MSGIAVRFAPSPTGHLHLGSARLALLNWLFARQHATTQSAQFFLRIEDTDQIRSSEAYTESILRSLKWLGLPWDGEPVIQSKRLARHTQVAEQLLHAGKAYWCYKPPQEADAIYDPEKPTLRLKIDRPGQTSFTDLLQGKITVQHDVLDDMVLIRGNGLPTYMFVVTVDDHDMGITHVIRGSDHLTNTARQLQIYQAMGWDIPQYAHVPLVLGPDKTKLSKRHGATNIEAYRDAGFLPEAILNALIRLGWGKGDREFFSLDDMLTLFRLEDLSPSAACFDLEKLKHWNAYYLRQKKPEIILQMLQELYPNQTLWSPEGYQKLLQGLPALQERSQTLQDLYGMLPIYAFQTCETCVDVPLETCIVLENFLRSIQLLADWSPTALETQARHYSLAHGMKLAQLAQPLRLILTRMSVSPPIFDVMNLLGFEWCLSRLHQVLAKKTPSVLQKE